MTTILLTGAGGQVGWELARSLMPLGDVVAPSRAEFDLARPAALRDHLHRTRPDVIVNAAAYTAVDQAESEREQAMTINAQAPAVMAEEARRLGALFVHFSTDYVFDGSKSGAYVEEDEPNPQNAYGRSKLAGEDAVRASGADHLIFRTSWVYAARGRNFLRTVLRLAGERDELRMVADQVGAPTCARLIADVTALALRESIGERRAGRFASGLYHLSAQGATSWHGFAARIVDLARAVPSLGPIRTETVTPIASSDYPLPARRPLNSRLSSDRLMGRFALQLPGWERCLECVMGELAGIVR